jgi:hypothetical protein
MARLRGKELTSVRFVPANGRGAEDFVALVGRLLLTARGLCVIVEELVPIACGLVIGLILGLLRPSLRVPIGVALISAFGALATLVSGEYLISWSFLLIDIPLVALSAAAGLFVMHRLRWGARRPR